MGNHQDLGPVFSALSDPTRREMIVRLQRGPATVTELGRPFDIALPNVLKHVSVLDRAGLITTHKTGRVKTCELRPEALDAPIEWLERHRAAWTTRLDALEPEVTGEERNPDHDRT